MPDLPEIQIEKVQQETIPFRGIRHTQSIAKLITSLCIARLSFCAIKKETTNPHWNKKYADIDTTISAIYKSLGENGLAVLQFPQIIDRDMYITTILAHSSGEWIESICNGPAYQGSRFDIQTVGSAETYLRRYAIQALLFLSAEDADGNDLIEQNEQSKKPSPAKPTIAVKHVEEDQLSSQSELDKKSAISKRLKNLNQDTRLLRQFVESQTGKDWKESSASELEPIASLLETAFKDGYVKDLLEGKAEAVVKGS